MPAAAIGPAIGLGTSLIGGIFGNRAAKKSGKIQSDAALEAAKKLEAAGERGILGINTAGEGAATGVEQAGQEAVSGVRSSGNAGRDRILESLGLLDPYTTAGSTAATQAASLTGSPVEKFSFDPATLGQDPGYQFRLAEANKIASQNAAAAGTLQSGGFFKALSDRAAREASQETDKMYGRQLSTFQTNQDAGNDRVSQLLSIMGLGSDAAGRRISGTTDASQLDLNAATTAGGMLGDTARTAGGFRTGAAGDAADLGFRAAGGAAGYNTDAAAAQAGGVVGGANAITGMLGNFGKVASGTDWGNIFKRKPRASPYSGGNAAYGGAF